MPGAWRRRGRPVRLRRPTEQELADHLTTVHGLLLPAAEFYIEGHRHPHLLRLHTESEAKDDFEPHEHVWD